jgi:molecular chaperone Hsp31 and glyoxalase 3
MPGLAFHGLEDSIPDWIPCPCQPTIYCAIAPDLVTASCLAMQLDVSRLSLSSKAIEAAPQDNRKYKLVAIVAAVSSFCTLDPCLTSTSIPPPNPTMSTDRKPVADQAEDDAWFPSPYSLTQYVAPKTDYDGTTYDNKYNGKKWKVLLIATQERYLRMDGGEFFSTGNHPVEMLLPVLHLDAAGFDVDVATVTGQPVKLEMWAFPKEDEAVKGIFEKYKQKLRQPLSLQDIWGEKGFSHSTPYIGIFVPGGHGAMNGLPFSKTVGDVLRWADAQKRYVISLCHGPAALLSGLVGKPEGSKFIYEGYKVVVFPESLDSGPNRDIGYIPSTGLPWLVGEELRKNGVEIVNSEMTGGTHRDRYLLTGDSPLASNSLGKMAAETLLEDVAKRS